MYEEFYGLSEKPFSLTPDPAFLYLSSSHREAMEHLSYGIKQKQGFILITGDIGTGKTTICRSLLTRLNEKISVALLLNPFYSEEDLLKYILIDFGITPAGKTKLDLVEELNKFLITHSSNGGIAVLIIDESQNLSYSILEQIRILSNLETEKEKLLQIVIVGQIELSEKLKSDRLRQLDQRIAVRYKLKHLNDKEVSGYIHHRLSVAGSKGKISFSNSAMGKIARYSKGIPRLINLICDRSLLNGYTKQKYHITARIVLQAMKSLHDEEKSFSIPVFLLNMKVFLTFGVIIFALAGLLFCYIFNYGFSGVFKNSERENRFIASSLLKKSAPDTSAFKEYVYDKDSPYTIFVTSYTSLDEAVRKAMDIKHIELPVYISRFSLSKKRDRYRILIGKFRTKTEALETKTKLKAEENLPRLRVIEAVSETGKVN